MTTKSHRTFPFMYVREWVQLTTVHKLPRDFIGERQTQEISNYFGRSYRPAIRVLKRFESEIGENDGFHDPACVIVWAIHPEELMEKTSWYNNHKHMMNKLQTLAELGDALLLDE